MIRGARDENFLLLYEFFLLAFLWLSKEFFHLTRIRNVSWCRTLVPPVVGSRACRPVGRTRSHDSFRVPPNQTARSRFP